MWLSLHPLPRHLHALAAFATLVTVASCGARTGLDLDGVIGSGLDGSVGDAARDGSLDASDAAVACVPGTFPLTQAFPAVMFVIDRSQSMNQRFAGGTSRWNVLKQALAATLPPADKTLALGALIFPSVGGSACAVPGAPNLLPARNNVSPLLDALGAQGPSGSTPTAAALDAAASALSALRTATAGRALVLATDGAPDCNAALNPATCRCVAGTRCNIAERCLDDKRTVDTIARYAAQSIPTYVVGIQDSASTSFSDVLDAMAVAGGRPRAGARKYYAATSSAELDAAFVAIRAQVGACTFLSSSVPSATGAITITLDGAVVPEDPSGRSGWRWVDKANGEIALSADFCGAATTSAGFTATVSCEPPDASTGDASEDDADVDAAP